MSNNTTNTILLLNNKEAIIRASKYVNRFTTGELECYSTGLSNWDEIIDGGLLPESFHVIASRPGIGKSLLALHLCKYLSERYKDKIVVIYWSMEMTAESQMIRLASFYAKKPFSSNIAKSSIEINNVLKQMYEKNVFSNVFIKPEPAYPSIIHSFTSQVINQIAKGKHVVNIYDHARLFYQESNQATEEAKLREVCVQIHKNMTSFKTTEVLIGHLKRDVEGERSGTSNKLIQIQQRDIFGADAISQYATNIYSLQRPSDLNIKQVDIEGVLFPTKDLLVISSIKGRFSKPNQHALLKSIYETSEIIDYGITNNGRDTNNKASSGESGKDRGGEEGKQGTKFPGFTE